MGDVYVATQLPVGRAVALKLMRASLLHSASTNPQAAARFEREARALAALSHPNIVTLFDFGPTDDGGLFLAMELLPGESLRARLNAQGRLPVDKALAVVADVCRGLEAAHRAGLVHRDLKPDNVMLVDMTSSGVPDEIVKVLDFGVAGVQQGTDLSAAPLTISGNVVGTPGYMAPEALLSGVVDDPRSDQYAVGVMLWELLTNHAVFSAPTPMGLVVRHAFDPPPTLASVLPQAKPHPALEALLQRLLAKEPAQRFSSSSAVVDAIAALPPAARAPLPGVVVNPASSSSITAPTVTTGPQPAILDGAGDDLDPDAPTSIAMSAFMPPSSLSPPLSTSASATTAVPVTRATPPGSVALVVDRAPLAARPRPVAALVVGVVVTALVVIAGVVALVGSPSSTSSSLSSSSVAPSSVVVPVVPPAPVVVPVVVPVLAPAPVVVPVVAPGGVQVAPSPSPARPAPARAPRATPPTTTPSSPHVPDMSP